MKLLPIQLIIPPPAVPVIVALLRLLLVPVLLCEVQVVLADEAYWKYDYEFDTSTSASRKSSRSTLLDTNDDSSTLMIDIDNSAFFKPRSAIGGNSNSSSNSVVGDGNSYSFMDWTSIIINEEHREYFLKKDDEYVYSSTNYR